MTRQIVVGVDGSQAAERALVWAADAASRDDAQLLIAHGGDVLPKAELAFEAASAQGSLAGKLRYIKEPVVSSGRFVKVFGWYDDGWGYTCRLADLTRLVAAADAH